MYYVQVGITLQTILPMTGFKNKSVICNSDLCWHQQADITSQLSAIFRQQWAMSGGAGVQLRLSSTEPHYDIADSLHQPAALMSLAHVYYYSALGAAVRFHQIFWWKVWTCGQAEWFLTRSSDGQNRIVTKQISLSVVVTYLITRSKLSKYHS